MDASAKRPALTAAERSRESRARRLERGEPSVTAVDRALRTIVLNRARTAEAVSLDDLVPEVVNLLMSDPDVSHRGCMTVLRGMIERAAVEARPWVSSRPSISSPRSRRSHSPQRAPPGYEPGDEGRTLYALK